MSYKGHYQSVAGGKAVADLTPAKRRIAVPSPTQQPERAAIVEVTISTDGRAAPLSVPVNKQRGDMVKWRAEQGGWPWTVTFDKGDGTPFREAVFDVPANGAVVSRETHETAEKKPYRYRVRQGTSPFTETHDPDVDVE